MDDDDAWAVPTTTMQDAVLQRTQDNTDDVDFDFDYDHTRSVEGDENRERWIKVFGFTNLDTVLQEFEKVGKIERYKPAAGRCVAPAVGSLSDFVRLFVLIFFVLFL